MVAEFEFDLLAVKLAPSDVLLPMTPTALTVDGAVLVLGTCFGSEVSVGGGGGRGFVGF